MRACNQVGRQGRPVKAVVGLAAALAISFGAAQHAKALEPAALPMAPAGLLPFHVGGLFGAAGGGGDDQPIPENLQLEPASSPVPRTETTPVNPLDALTPYLPAAGEWRHLPGLEFNRYRLSDTEANNLGVRGSAGSVAVLSNQTGAAFDSEGNFWYFWGGGTNVYGGNEVYRLDLSVLQMSQITPPSVLDHTVNLGGGQSCLVPSDASAASSTFDGMVWSPVTQSFFVFPSGGYCLNGTLPNGMIWEFDPLSGTWETISEMGGVNGPVFAEYDSASGRIYFIEGGSNATLRELNPVTGQLGSKISLNRAMTIGNAILDRASDQMIVFAQQGVFSVSLSNLGASTQLANVPAGFDPTSGAAFDRQSGLIALWDGGKDVRTFDTISGDWAVQSPASGPTSGPGGVFSKWVAIEDLGIFLGYQNASEGLWIYRMASNPVVSQPVNRAPVADTGASQVSAHTGRVVNLSGAGSFDPDGDSLTYAWSMVTAPSGASQTLSTPNKVTTSFTPNKDGSYVLRLTVSDGALSDTATVTVTATNTAPVANAGPDQNAIEGDTVSLNGSGSSDADGDSLSYSWSLTSKPSGSTASLTNASSQTPQLTLDVAGNYVARLVVSDGLVSSAADTVTIVTAINQQPAGGGSTTPVQTNTPPVANAGPDQNVAVGLTATVNGNASSDADGHPLTYSWSLVSRPSGSTATLAGTGASRTLMLDLAGAFVLQLIVNDGFVNSAADTVTVTAVAQTSGGGSTPTSDNNYLTQTAAGMSIGQLKTIVTNNFTSGLVSADGCNQTGRTVFEWANNANWDAVRNELHFVGQGHLACEKHLVYNGTTNTWTTAATPPMSTFNHAYDHNAMDPATGNLFIGRYNTTQIYKYNRSNKSWGGVTSPPVSVSASHVIEYFPEMGGLAFVDSRAGVWKYEEANSRWTQLASGKVNICSGCTSITAIGDYNIFGTYNPTGKILLFGGGNSSTAVYKLSANGTVTKVASSPVELGIARGLVLPNTENGNFLAFANDGKIYEYQVSANRWVQVGTHPITGAGGSVSGSRIAAAIPEYGVYVFFTSSPVGSYMYKYGTATGGTTSGGTTSGGTTSGGTTSGGTTSGGTPPAADFATRCADSNVIQCFDFDTQAATAPYLYCGFTCPSVDNLVASSGSGSLKFTVPTMSPADSSGAFSINFTPGTANDGSSPAYPIQFGEGEEFYVQWRQRFSPEMLTNNWGGGSGWKQAIINEGDRPGYNAFSCTYNEVVVQNSARRGFPQMYHSCGGKDGKYENLFVAVGNADFDLQYPSGCLYSQQNNPQEPPCSLYHANEWMTFQVHVKVGTYYKNDKNYCTSASRQADAQARGIADACSTIEMWVSREGQPAKPTLRITNYDLVNSNPSAMKYGSIWLLPYHSNKPSSQDHPTAYTWYDDLIISRGRIADPN